MHLLASFVLWLHVHARSSQGGARVFKGNKLALEAGELRHLCRSYPVGDRSLDHNLLPVASHALFRLERSATISSCT